MYQAYMELVEGGSDVNPDDNTSVKLIKSGWALMVLMIITAFQSSFTAFLVRDTYHLPISGMDDCIDKRCTVCMTAFLETEMRATYSNSINYRGAKE